jgi:integrase
MAFLMVLRRMGLDITAHGFRSTFRVWCAEKTNFAREVAEAALAHNVKNATEAAYMRSDFLELRRELMAEWSMYAAHPLHRAAGVSIPATAEALTVLRRP